MCSLRPAWPDIHTYPDSNPRPYERDMGERIAALLRLFQSVVPDLETNAKVLELAICPLRWSAAHALFNNVRRLLLVASTEKDQAKSAQYHFAEACLKVLYNATNPPGPFDPGAGFWIAGASIHLARRVAVPVEAVVAIFAP